MSEYVATVMVKRSARGEGDEPVLLAAASSTKHDTFTKLTPEGAIDRALDEAMQKVRAALASEEAQS